MLPVSADRRAACRSAAVEVIFSRMGVKCDENWHIKAPFPFRKPVRGKDGGIRRPCPRCRFRRSHLLPLPPAVRQYFISSVVLGIRPGMAAQVADFEACSVAFGDLGSFSAHSLPSGSGFFGKSIRRRASGQSAVFTLRKLEAQFSLQRLYLLREDGGWEM